MEPVRISTAQCYPTHLFSSSPEVVFLFTVCRAVTINSRDFNVCSEICEIGRWLVVAVLGDNFSLTVDFQLWKVLVKYTSAQVQQ